MMSVCDICGLYIAREDLVIRGGGRYHRQCVPEDGRLG